MNETLTKEVMKRLKEATELAVRLSNENEKLRRQLTEMIEAYEKIRRLEREAILIPNLN